MELKDKQIEIETTNICPASCLTCPRDKFSQKLGIMDFDLFKKIVNDASAYDLKSIVLTGFGEPFCDKLLFERCRYVREKLPQAKIYISSTCFLMTPDTYENVIKYVDILKISIFGLTKESYEKNHRGSVKFEKSVSNILGLLEKIKDLPKRPYTIGLMVVTDSNKSEMKDWIRFWEEKLNEVFVWLPHNWTGARNYRTIDTKQLVSCGRPLHGPLYVHIDGQVSMCCFDFNKNLVIGDMKKQNIYDIFHSESFKKLQVAHQSKDFKGYICENCDQINLDTSVLLYASNKKRKVGQITSNFEDMKPQ